MRKFTEYVYDTVTFENLNTLESEHVDLGADFEGCYSLDATYTDPAESDYDDCVWDEDTYDQIVDLLQKGFSYKGETDQAKVFQHLEDLLSNKLTYTYEPDCEEF